jgi:hypothetical protein
MKKRLLLPFLLVLSLAGLTAQSPLAEAYAWHFPAPDTVRQAGDLIGILREECDKILDTGPLAPIRLAFGDLHWEHYFQYQEPGRILTTLAWSWPYLSPEQQTRTLDYVENELNTPGRAPWTTHYTIPRDQGARREWYPSAQFYGVDNNFGDFRPRLHTLYGFWLFCYRSGQTAWMESYYPALKSFYQSQHNRARLYGDMNGHLAMARLAWVNGDLTMEQFALGRLQQELEDGLQVENKHHYAANGLNGWDAPYNRLPGTDMYDHRKDGWLYRGFIFLNMGPEVARFLKDSCFQQVDSMHQAGKRILPMWWLMQAPYYPRWTGDESIGLPTEAFGMYHPVETWVLQTPATGLRRFMRSSPTGIGDCYWLEALVQTIEAHAAHTAWLDVRESSYPLVVLEEGPVRQEIPAAAAPAFELVPNPAADRAELRLSAWNGPVHWAIRDMKGTLLAQGEALAPIRIPVDLRGWSSGSYLCTIAQPALQRSSSQILIIP